MVYSVFKLLAAIQWIHREWAEHILKIPFDTDLSGHCPIIIIFFNFTISTSL